MKKDPAVENIKKLLGVTEDLIEAMKVQQNMIILMAKHLDKTSEGLLAVIKIIEKDKPKPKKKKKGKK